MRSNQTKCSFNTTIVKPHYCIITRQDKKNTVNNCHKTAAFEL